MRKSLIFDLLLTKYIFTYICNMFFTVIFFNICLPSEATHNKYLIYGGINISCIFLNKKFITYNLSFPDAPNLN